MDNQALVKREADLKQKLWEELGQFLLIFGTENLCNANIGINLPPIYETAVKAQGVLAVEPPSIVPVIQVLGLPDEPKEETKKTVGKSRNPRNTKKETKLKLVPLVEKEEGNENEK